MRTTYIASSAAILALLAGFGLRPAPVDKPLVSLAGSHSLVAKPRVEVISDATRWEAVWKEHMGEKLEKTAHGFDVIPHVDFSRCMVFAAFAGSSNNGAGYEVVEVLTRDHQTVIRYDRTGFQTASFDGADHGVKTSDYGFAVLTRSALPLTLEENTQSLIGGPPIWTERQKMPALPAFKPDPQRGN